MSLHKTNQNTMANAVFLSLTISIGKNGSVQHNILNLTHVEHKCSLNIRGTESTIAHGYTRELTCGIVASFDGDHM